METRKGDPMVKIIEKTLDMWATFAVTLWFMVIDMGYVLIMILFRVYGEPAPGVAEIATYALPILLCPIMRAIIALGFPRYKAGGNCKICFIVAGIASASILHAMRTDLAACGIPYWITILYVSATLFTSVDAFSIDCSSQEELLVGCRVWLKASVFERLPVWAESIATAVIFVGVLLKHEAVVYRGCDVAIAVSTATILVCIVHKNIKYR